jgi:hypothetical protein
MLVFLCAFFVSCGKQKTAKTNIVSFVPKEMETYREDQFNAYGQSGITENEFNEVIDGFEQVYQPIIEQIGFNMTVERKWEDSTINAYAQKDGKNVILSMFGGLARHKYMTKLGFALVLCHEYSHITGGYPFYSGSDMMSVEGQSDMGSTANCGKQILGLLSPVYFAPEYEYVEAMRVCYAQQDATTCQRLLAGGLSLGKVLASLGKENMPRYETPDRTIVTKTMESHPKAQCRLTTYYAGTMCNKTWDMLQIPKSRKESEIANCARPRCWYAG